MNRSKFDIDREFTGVELEGNFDILIDGFSDKGELERKVKAACSTKTII
jgi:hypothetical protein